ncbi:MAG: glycerophosphodiester phosphodiesterase family protein [Chitinophagaceae bacterium]|nr:glycerophosphodiester phosphodiesterase family protein [Chitinophagaceae bacterium]
MRLASFIILFVSLFAINESNAQTTKLPLVRHHHKFIVIAHRGDHTNAPENTIAAYKNAIKIGADFIEVDLRTTKDSQLVVMHDATINRMTGINGSIHNMTFDSLKKLEVRESKHPEWGYHVIPTFQEVLKLSKRKINIYLDFKNASAKATYNEIVASGMENNVIVYINNPNQFTDWRNVAPNIPLMISLPGKVKTKEALFQVLEKNQTDLLDGNYNEYNAETVAAAKEKNIPIWADIQSVDENPTLWDKALNLSLQGLQTDHPKALIDYLKKKGIR